eukprot:6892316-Prorocentrum_lima.AAC.1
MTSSLVGSEMCIRDRLPEKKLLHWVVHRQQLSKCQGMRSTSLDPLSVSYTHLTLPTICSV